MKIKKIWVEIETEPGKTQHQAMDFRTFVAHISAANQASGHWPLQECVKLQDTGARPDNYDN